MIGKKFSTFPLVLILCDIRLELLQNLELMGEKLSSEDAVRASVSRLMQSLNYWIFKLLFYFIVLLVWDGFYVSCTTTNKKF